MDDEEQKNFCPSTDGNPNPLLFCLPYSLYQLNYSSYSIAVSIKHNRNNSGPQNWSSFGKGGRSLDLPGFKSLFSQPTVQSLH
jgi:hypothetical protein